MRDISDFVKTHTGKKILCICGVTVNAQLESEGRMKRGPAVHFYTTISLTVIFLFTALEVKYTLKTFLYQNIRKNVVSVTSGV